MVEWSPLSFEAVLPVLSMRLVINSVLGHDVKLTPFLFFCALF